MPSLHRSGMLASICALAKSLAVAGTHGKTSTTSMLMLILAEAGLRPSFVIGGDVTDMGTGAQWTGGEWLVVEADESDGTHLTLPLYGTILTNVEVDHLDYYGTARRHRRRLRSLPRADRRPEGAVHRRPGHCAASRPRTTSSPTAPRPPPTSVATNVQPGGGAFTFDVRARRRRCWAASRCRCVACTTCATPPVRWPWP